MVNIYLLQEMKEKYNRNLRRYIKNHPGEFVLFEGYKLKTSFYKTEKSVDKALNKYERYFGATFLVKEIPVKTHRFNKNNKKIELLEELVRVCPNDGETKLEQHLFLERAVCQDCGYIAFTGRPRPLTKSQK